MTTLYKPVLIESAEQAEALDGKTPIHIVLDRTQEVHDVKLFEDFAEDFWPDALEPGNLWVYVALVPTEAEEETRKHPYRVEERVGYVYRQPVQQVRYKTRWESA